MLPLSLLPAYQKPPLPQFTHNPFTTRWSSLHELTARRTRNPAVPGSSPAMMTMFHDNPELKSSATFVNSQLVCLQSVGILNNDIVMFS